MCHFKGLRHSRDREPSAAARSCRINFGSADRFEIIEGMDAEDAPRSVAGAQELRSVVTIEAVDRDRALRGIEAPGERAVPSAIIACNASRMEALRRAAR
jgi:hypothetical protein